MLAGMNRSFCSQVWRSLEASAIVLPGTLNDSAYPTKLIL
jgi:hypothetical protein